jgi:cytochrome c nitrite reductase small subunit
MTRWLIGLGILAGLVAGIGGYTFIYAKGASYLTNDPAACANCHVMSDYYTKWQRSSHRSVAVCNDCHTPEGFLPKYATKASNGFWHSFYFTTGNFPDNIQITPANRTVAADACLKCHEPITRSMSPGHDKPTGCLKCHGKIGHPQ